MTDYKIELSSKTYLDGVADGFCDGYSRGWQECWDLMRNNLFADVQAVPKQADPPCVCADEFARVCPVHHGSLK